MLKRFKRYLLSRLISAIEAEATANNKWTSNIETALCTITIINNHREKLDAKKFIIDNKQQEFTSTFNSFESLVHWLEGVNNLHRYFGKNIGDRSIPEEYTGLIRTNNENVRLTRFLADSDHKVVSIVEYIDIAHKQLSEIYANYITLPPVVRQVLNRKLHNGYNTVLVLNELVIEVMIDVE